jgi:hypothetical protein
MVRRRNSYALKDAPAGPDQVTNIIQGYWIPITQAFKQAGYKAPSAITRLRIDSEAHDNCRHYAMAKKDGTVMIVGPEIVDLPPENIVGILAHEAGHFVDFDNPGRFWFRRPQMVRVRKGARAVSLTLEPVSDDHDGPLLFFFSDLPGKGFIKHMRDWKDRSDDEVERVADEIASYVLGERIGYTGKPGCLIQTAGKGVERPIGLR